MLTAPMASRCIAFVALFVAPAAHAWPWAFRTQVCLAMLAEAGNPHYRAESLRDEDTRAATTALRDFRLDTLGVERTAGRSPARLRTGSGAGAKTVQRVADRIGALLRDARGPEAGGAPNLQFTPTGIVVRDRESAAALLDVLERESQPAVARWLAPGSGLLWGMPLVSLYFLGKAGGAIPSSVDVVHYAVLLAVVETLARGWPSRYDFGFRRHQRRMRAFLENPEAHGWLYDADTVPIDTSDLEGRLDRGPSGQAVELTLDALVDPRWADLVKNFANVTPVFRQLFGRLLYGTPSPTWAAWDRLLYRDLETGEPVLVLFARYFRDRPAFPAPAPDPSPTFGGVPVFQLSESAR